MNYGSLSSPTPAHTVPRERKTTSHNAPLYPSAITRHTLLASGLFRIYRCQSPLPSGFLEALSVDSHRQCLHRSAAGNADFQQVVTIFKHTQYIIHRGSKFKNQQEGDSPSEDEITEGGCGKQLTPNPFPQYGNISRGAILCCTVGPLSYTFYYS